MRTQAIRLSIGAYRDGCWHVAVVEDHYDRGVLIDSTLESLSHPTTEAQLRQQVARALDRIIDRERERVGSGGASDPGR